MSHLILVRHGQSEWNSQNRFTGWVDVDLTANGKLEACKAGELIKDLNIVISHFYTSYQKRAINTLKLILNTIRVKNEKILKACVNILVHYKMIEGEAHYPSIRYKGYQQALLAPKSGVFLPNKNIKFLSMMKKNDFIAAIIDYQGNELCQLTAPADGMIFGLRALPNVTVGEWCCFYAIIEGEW